MSAGPDSSVAALVSGGASNPGGPNVADLTDVGTVLVVVPDGPIVVVVPTVVELVVAVIAMVVLVVDGSSEVVVVEPGTVVDEVVEVADDVDVVVELGSVDEVVEVVESAIVVDVVIVVVVVGDVVVVVEDGEGALAVKVAEAEYPHGSPAPSSWQPVTRTSPTSLMMIGTATSFPEGSAVVVPANRPPAVSVTLPSPRNPVPLTIVAEPLSPSVGATLSVGAGCARPGAPTKRPMAAMSATAEMARVG